MTRYRFYAAAAVGALTLGGCTRTLDVRPITAAGPRTGVGYVLPFTQFSTTVSWRLDYCPDPTNPDPNKGSDPKIVVKVEAVAGSADDKDLAFMLDPQALQSLTSVTTFSAKWQDGRNLFSTINMSAEDHSAQILGNVVKTAVKVIPLAMGVPPVGLLAPGGKPKGPCGDGMLEAVQKATAARLALQVANNAVDDATDALKEANAKVAAMGAAVDKESKKALSDALDALAAAKLAQAAAAEDLVNKLKPISYVRKFVWPEDGNSFSRAPVGLDDATLHRWIRAPEAWTNVRDQLKPIYLQIERTGSFGRLPQVLKYEKAADQKPGTPPYVGAVADAGDAGYALPSATQRGLRYRMPAAGRLVACSITPCRSANPDSVIASFDAPIVQLGYVNVLPFRSRAFGSNSFSAEFAPDGSLRAVGYEQKTAPAESLSGAVADAAGQVSGALDPTTRLQAHTSYLKALKDNRDALEALKAKTPDPLATETDGINAEKALLDAKLARLNAEIALEQAQAKRNP